MTVFGHSNGGGGFLAGKQVFPVDYEAEASQHLLEASSANDLQSALECIAADPHVDVNFVGAVCLKIRKTEVVLFDELPNEVRVEYEEFRTDVTPLFLAVHNGNVSLVRKLLSIGADVNQKLYKGYATTASVREGNLEILEILIKSGACQDACEEALLEATSHGHDTLAKFLMSSDLIRPHIAVNALFTACCRGFVNVVDALLKCGVDVNATSRVLLQSHKPFLHASADCTALVAAIVSRQVSVVRLLLQAGAKTDIKVQLGAWSWDTNSGEEFRVGAGLGEPYPITWCAVEYYESSGSILRMLVQHITPGTLHCGRSLLHHAVLCYNTKAVKILLENGFNIESVIETTKKTKFRPIHIASRLGYSCVLQTLIDADCDVNSRTRVGDTALMISARFNHEGCLKVLAKAGADFGLVNKAGRSANTVDFSFRKVILEVIRNGVIPRTSNVNVFSPLMFVAKSGDVSALKALIGHGKIGINLDEQDENGLSAVMVTVMEGHVDAFRVLVYAGADVTSISLSELNPNSSNHDLFEKVMLEYALERGNSNSRGFYALHFASRRGDLEAVKLLTKRDYAVNIFDKEGYTPLMLAAREGHGKICRFLLSCGARSDIMNGKGETALSLARMKGFKQNDAELVILDELARTLVLNGSRVQKHTRGGKGKTHEKIIKMVVGEGVLSWGNSKKRNVVCRDAHVGPSLSFRKNRRKYGDADEAGLFGIITTKGKEIHFVVEGGFETASLWVRGIKLLTKKSTT